MKTKLLLVLVVMLLCVSCGGGQNPPDNPNGNNQFPSTINKPVPYFLAKNSHPFYVTFTNKSKYADSYKWNFGDGTTSTEESPVHKYSKKGVYAVTLTVYNGRSNYGWVHTETYTQIITVTEPTTCYVTGVVFETVPYNNEYYSVRFTDDYVFFETCYWYTDWCLLSSANIPYEYTFKNMYKLDFSKNTYVMRLYQNSKKSGTGTQLKAWTVSTSDIMNKYSEKRTGTADNVKVTLLLKWYD